MSMRKWYKRRGEAMSMEGQSSGGPFFQGQLVTPSRRGVAGKEVKIQEARAMSSVDAWSALQAAHGIQGAQKIQSHIAGPSSFKSLPRGVVPSRGPRTRFFDPLALMYATGYRDRRFSVSYNTLRLLTYQLASVGAIINVRVKQIAAFAQPFRQNKQIGFEVRFKDPNHIPTEEDEKAIQRLEGFIGNCGWGVNPHTYQKRPRFRSFLSMFIRDSLTFDQSCFEIVPDTEGRPFEFFAIDSSSIRLAATFDGHRGPGPQKLKAHQFTEKWKKMFQKELELDPEEERIHTVQLIHGRIENVYGYYDLAFCIRNQRSDLWVNGYGFAEAEMCINMMLGMLWGEEYNRRFFKQGAAPKGILNIKGEGISPEELESFRRQWYAMIAGVENAWRTPVLQADGMEYQNLQNTNAEMQFQEWLNYQMRIVCAVYGIDPLEINQEMAASGSTQGPMFEAQHEWKLKHSRDKGLRPLLKFVQEALQEYLIDPLDSRMMIEFVGLDEMTEKDKIDLIVLKTQNIATVNEGRAEIGLPPRPGCDYINSPQYIQAAQMLQAAGVNPFLSNEDIQTPYQTAGEHPQPQYGEGPAVPLYLQRRTLGVDEWSDGGGDRAVMQAGGGEEGGAPPAGGAPPGGGPGQPGGPNPTGPPK